MPCYCINNIFNPHLSLNILRKEIKNELKTTLFNEKAKLNLLYFKLNNEIDAEINKNNNFLSRSWKKFFHNSQTDIIKSQKLCRKILKINQQNVNVSLSSETSNALHCIHQALINNQISPLKKGEISTLSIDSGSKCFQTAKGIYVIEELLGEGGFQRAQKIFDVTKGKHAVFLSLKGENQGNKIRHMLYEEQAFIALKNTSETIRCKEIVHQNNIPAFILQYANAGPLYRNFRSLSEQEQEQIAIDILTGLANIHAKGIIHRDIKPDNILLINKAKAGQPRLLKAKIADFDLCVPPGHSTLALEARKYGCGTRGFKAPEIEACGKMESIVYRRTATFHATTKAMDIYSMGITLYYLFQGPRPPRKNKEEHDIAADIQFIRDQLELPAPKVRFASLIRSMVAMDPLHRPTAQSALEAFKKATGRPERMD